MTQETQRRLAAVICADVVGYSRLMGGDEIGTLATMRAHREELWAPLAKRYGGRIVGAAGDSFLIEFNSAVAAVETAVAIQNGLADRNRDLPENKQMRLRLGINIGEIIVDEEGIFGDGVNIAARMQELAEHGGICVSESVFSQVSGKLDLGFANLGEQKVKNIVQPVPTYQVLMNPDDVGKVIQAKPKVSRRGVLGLVGILAAIALAVFGVSVSEKHTTPADTNAKRVLVLPFAPLNGEAQIYANAVSENLWLSLARIKGLTLVERKQALKFKGMQPSREQISELNDVTHILDGTVATDGDDVIIKSRLSAVSDAEGINLQEVETHSSPTEVFDRLSQHKTSFTSSLKIPLNDNERAILERVQTESVQAYLLYAEGLQIWMAGGFTELKSALKMLKQAAEIDPQFFDARGRYAYLNYFIWFQSWNIVRNTLDAYEDAVATAEELLEDDPLNSDALNVQTAIMLQLDREKALTMARGAVFQTRNDPTLLRSLGWAFLSNGYYEEARAEFQTYQDLSPRLTSPEALNLSNAYLRLGEPERALELISQMIPEALSGFGALFAQAEAYSRLGRKEEGKKFAQTIFQFLPFYSVNWDEPKFRTFKDPAVFQVYSNAMRDVGFPLWPLEFDKGRDADRLGEDDLRELFGRKFRTIDTTDPVGGKYTGQYDPDGTLSLRYAFLPDIHFEGTWEISGDEICIKLPASSMGLRTCERVYVDQEKSTPANPRYVLMNGFGLHWFGVEYLED